MPALKPTNFTAEIIWIGHVPNRDDSLRSLGLKTANVSFAGIEDESHGGLTRASCSRVLSQHRRGTEIRNTRQFSIMSQEQLAQIAQGMGVSGLTPDQVGASLMLRGIPDFTHVPPSSRLQTPVGTTLIVDMENRPCHLPAKVIDETFPSKGRAFKTAASGKRGVTASVERPGPLSVGDVFTLHIPDQPVWAHLREARGGV